MAYFDRDSRFIINKSLSNTNEAQSGFETPAAQFRTLGNLGVVNPGGPNGLDASYHRSGNYEGAFETIYDLPTEMCNSTITKSGVSKPPLISPVTRPMAPRNTETESSQPSPANRAP